MTAETLAGIVIGIPMGVALYFAISAFLQEVRCRKKQKEDNPTIKNAFKKTEAAV